MKKPQAVLKSSDYLIWASVGEPSTHRKRNPMRSFHPRLTAFSATVPQTLFDITPVIQLRDGQPSDRYRTFWSAVTTAC